MKAVSVPNCISCGETIAVQICPSCGAEVAFDHDHDSARPARSSASDATRLRGGGERDRAAALRDRGAEVRDSLARRHDRARDAASMPEDASEQAAGDRDRAALDREQAANDRALAAADRELAAAERAEALAIRAESAGLLERAATDELTGARTRILGLDEAAREVERARRKGAQLMVAFVDVDGLKQVNDTRGHQAGDALLQSVGKALRANLRPYDVIVRFGGDEFLCAMPDLSPREARARFARIAHTLAAIDIDYSISFGLAQAWPGEGLTALIARADADLLRLRARKAG